MFLVELADPFSPIESREPHLHFYWVPVTDLAGQRLLPAEMTRLVARYVEGDGTAWWATNIP